MLRRHHARKSDAKVVAGAAPLDVLHELRRLYYDTASATSPASMAALLNLAPAQQVLFGSDYPFVQTASSLAELARVKLSLQDRRAIERGNAERLLPSVKPKDAVNR